MKIKDSQRKSLFDRFTEATQTACQAIDESRFDPAVLPVVRKLGTVCETAFMAYVNDRGQVYISEDKLADNGIAIFPLVDPREVIVSAPSVKMPTPVRIEQSAIHAGVSVDRLQAAFDDKLRADVADKWMDTDTAHGTVACNITRQGTIEVDGKEVYYASRPFLVLSPDMNAMSPRLQASIGVHELTHAIDGQDGNEYVEYTELEILQNFVRGELRAEHVGHTVAQLTIESDGTLPISPLEASHLRFGQQSETLRLQNATETDHFAVSPQTVDQMARLFLSYKASISSYWVGHS